jgi:hypothetical protein
MKQKLLLQMGLIIFAVVFIMSCQKDINDFYPDPTPGDNFPIPTASRVDGSLSGLIVDENNSPVAGAEVSCSGTTILSDARGIFSFTNIVLDKYISTVTVKMPGYFKAYRSFSANPTRNHVHIKLIPKELTATVSSNAGGSATLTNGTIVTLPGNGFIIKNTGAPYTGDVKVFAAYIDPTASDISTTVPGSFMGKDANNLYILQSTGMIAVDLESPAGEALQLATGAQANIKLPIPSSLTNNAPGSIDTWSLDEAGIWIKEGTASRNGNSYEMSVTHFSFWNCDVPMNAVYLNIHVQDQNGNSLPNALVELSIPNNNTWWGYAYEITDSLGNASGLVPAGLGLILDIYGDPYSCNTPLYSQTIGPFTTNSSITITVTLAAQMTTTITGTVTDCSSQPLQNGTAIIYAGLYNYQHVSIVNGTYNATVTHCGTLSSVDVFVRDSLGNFGSSDNVPVTGNTVTVANIGIVCGSQNGLFTFPANCQASISGSYVAGTSMNSSNYVLLTVDVTRTGGYTIWISTLNGVNFSSNGTFTALGLQTIILQASGTPLATGTFTWQNYSTDGGVNNHPLACPFSITFSGSTTTPAVFILGGPGACLNATVNGNYSVGLMLNSTNTLTIPVNVTSAGSYYVNTGTTSTNGIYFQDSGYFANTGTQVITLTGVGTPINAGTTTLTLSSSSGSSWCTVAINVTNTTPQAVLTLTGTTNSPDSCTAISVSGNYVAGVLLTNNDVITLRVEVTSPGSYDVITSAANGVYFGGSGIVTTVGTQYITIRGFGTPYAPGSYVYTTTINGSPGCWFLVTYQ